MVQARTIKDLRCLEHAFRYGPALFQEDSADVQLQPAERCPLPFLEKSQHGGKLRIVLCNRQFGGLSRGAKQQPRNVVGVRSVFDGGVPDVQVILLALLRVLSRQLDSVVQETTKQSNRFEAGGLGKRRHRLANDPWVIPLLKLRLRLQREHRVVPLLLRHPGVRRQGKRRPRQCRG